MVYEFLYVNRLTYNCVVIFNNVGHGLTVLRIYGVWAWIWYRQLFSVLGDS